MGNFCGGKEYRDKMHDNYRIFARFKELRTKRDYRRIQEFILPWRELSIPNAEYLLTADLKDELYLIPEGKDLSSICPVSLIDGKFVPSKSVQKDFLFVKPESVFWEAYQMLCWDVIIEHKHILAEAMTDHLIRFTTEPATVKVEMKTSEKAPITSLAIV